MGRERSSLLQMEGLRLGFRLGFNQEVFLLRCLRTEGFLKVVPKSGDDDRF